MMVCDICGKGKAYGKSQKHHRGVAGKRWKKRVTATPRLFVPNLQKKTVIVLGKKKQMKLCAKCIKRIKKYKSIDNYKSISFL